MKKCAFTIVAKNYVGLAQILKKSIQVNNKDVDFFTFVADELPNEKIKDDNDIIEARKIVNIEEWLRIEMSFKYDLTEYCTAIKPSCFNYLFKTMNYEMALYFDPDIYVYSDISDIYNVLSGYSIYLTPHILFPVTNNRNDVKFLQSGPYNLGFCGLRKTTTAMSFLDWWENKLKYNCFDDIFEYTFTDQKWTLMVTSLFDPKEIFISRSIGMNVAPWNFYERKILVDNNELFVTDRKSLSKKDKLYFVHFSGYDYKALLEGTEVRPRTTIEDTDYEDIKILINRYYDELQNNKLDFLKYISLEYTYNYYENGDYIEKFHRRLYHRIIEIDNHRFNNPFSTTNGSFHSLLRNKGMYMSHPVRRLSEGQVSNNNKKLKAFNRLMKIVFRIIGYKNYLMLLRMLKHFSRYESQVFLIDDKYMNNNIELPQKQTI